MLQKHQTKQINVPNGCTLQTADFTIRQSIEFDLNVDKRVFPATPVTQFHDNFTAILEQQFEPKENETTNEIANLTHIANFVDEKIDAATLLPFTPVTNKYVFYGCIGGLAVFIVILLIALYCECKKKSSRRTFG